MLHSVGQPNATLLSYRCAGDSKCSKVHNCLAPPGFGFGLQSAGERWVKLQHTNSWPARACAGWPAVSAAHIGWGAGALFAVATVLGLVSNYGMFHVREGAS